MLNKSVLYVWWLLGKLESLATMKWLTWSNPAPSGTKGQTCFHQPDRLKPLRLDLNYGNSCLKKVPKICSRTRTFQPGRFTNTKLKEFCSLDSLFIALHGCFLALTQARYPKRLHLTWNRTRSTPAMNLVVFPLGFCCGFTNGKS